MSSNLVPTTKGMSRVFLIENRARPDHLVDYQGCMIAAGIDWSLGDSTPIKCPSPDQPSRWDEVGEFQGEEGRPTSSLTSLFSLDAVSLMERLAKRKCAYDVHINFGDCDIPTKAGTFKKKIIWEAVKSTNYGTDELGALTDGDNAQINETTDFSGKQFYTIVPLTTSSVGGDVVTNPLEDVVICSNISCGDCDDEDEGCEIIYAVGDSSPGSPGTAPDVIYSTDEGATLAADEITTMTNAENADGIACLGDFVVVVSNDDGGIHYKLKATINAGTAANWTRTATGIVAGGEPNDIWSVGQYAFVVGDGGYVYGTANPVSGLTVLDAGSATTQNLAAVHALNSTFAVAVGAAGAVVRTEDQVTWSLVTAPAAVSLQCVWIISKRVWWVGASNGAVYYTLDAGSSWTQYTNFPVTLTNVQDIAFHNDSVGYIAGSTAGPVGVILRTYSNGGTQPDAWVVMPEGVGSLPAADQITALAACKNDPNFVVGVGLADDALDGVYIIGNA